MSSSITHAQTPTIHPLAHILGSCAFTSVVAPFLQFIPTPSCNGIPPLSRCNKSPERGRAVRRNTGTTQKWPREIQSSTYGPELSTPFYLSRIVAQSPRSSLCCPKPPSHLQSNRTSVYPVPALHLLPPSSPF